MPQVEHYRDDLEFNTDNVAKLQRSTLCLADYFNEIFEQVFSNDKSLKDSITEIVTGFAATVISALVGSALASTVDSVSSQSVFYKLLQKALEAAGVEWNFNNSNAWYICFGDLLGGLIIQGGWETQVSPNTFNQIVLPITLSKNYTYNCAFAIEASDSTPSSSFSIVKAFASETTVVVIPNGREISVHWIVFGT